MTLRHWVSACRYVVGTALLVHGGLPVVQNVREMIYTARAQRAYDVTRHLETPIEFGGHVIDVRDSLPQLRSSESPEREGLVGIEMDGQSVLAPTRGLVSLSAVGLSRYWFWIQAQTVRDRSTNVRTLVVARRLLDSPADNPTFEVLQIFEDGHTSISTASAADRRTSPLLTVVLTPLAGEVPLLPYMSYWFPVTTNFLPLAMLLSALPVVSIAGGLWLLISTARRRAHA